MERFFYGFVLLFHDYFHSLCSIFDIQFNHFDDSYVLNGRIPKEEWISFSFIDWMSNVIPNLIHSIFCHFWCFIITLLLCKFIYECLLCITVASSNDSMDSHNFRRMKHKKNKFIGNNLQRKKKWKWKLYLLTISVLAHPNKKKCFFYLTFILRQDTLKQLDIKKKNF